MEPKFKLANPVVKTCANCGATFEVEHRLRFRSDLCRPCQAERTRENNRAWQKRNRDNQLQKRYQTCHFVGFLPGYPKEDGDLNFVGRYLAMHEVKCGPTGFLPDGLLLEVRNGARVTETGVVINGRPVFTKTACNSGGGDV
jgi:hypothetical protein